MRTILKTIASAALIGFLGILPFVILEVINRRAYNEDFPFVLFFSMWQLLFAIFLMLLPIVSGWWAGHHVGSTHDPAAVETPLTDPRSAMWISLGLILAFGAIYVLNALGWLPLQKLIDGPNPGEEYLPGFFISAALFMLPVAAGFIASLSVGRTLRAGGSLFSHPILMIIVVSFLSIFAISLASLVADQWPCFIGVPVCD